MGKSYVSCFFDSQCRIMRRPGCSAPGQIRWCAAVQTLVNCHCKLDENPVGNVEPMQLVVQYLTKTAIKLPSAGDNTRSSVQHPL